MKSKDKERVFKASREKRHITYRGTTIKKTGDFSSRTMKVTRQWSNILKVPKVIKNTTRLGTKTLQE